jgi:hypothetical protein
VPVQVQPVALPLRRPVALDLALQDLPGLGLDPAGPALAPLVQVR